MTDLDQYLEAGTLLIIETGYYSDFNYHGPVVVKKRFLKREVAEKFAEEEREYDPEEQCFNDLEPSKFLPWLIRNGYVEDVNVLYSWHIGSYGTFEP